MGPGLLVTAAFIGPGTVTTASVAGAHYGYALVWALLFSVLATIVLQEMAARLALVTGGGLAEALRRAFAGSWLAFPAMAMVVLTLGVGNAAYQAGNLTGAAMGLQGLVALDAHWWVLLVGIIAAMLLGAGGYRHIERALVVLVLLMSAMFIATFLLLRPDLSAIVGALANPRLPQGSILTVLALIGTTVVPYNLFLHASAVATHWRCTDDRDAALRSIRLDSGLSIGLGGLVTLAVMGAASAAFFASGAEVTAATMARQLEPLVGSAARYLFALGLFAAGLSSAVTAPLAAAFAVCGALGWSTELNNTRFRCVWGSVLAVGVLFAMLGSSPVAAILFAQAANGLLLPGCALFLIALMNRRDVLGEYRNRLPSNLAGALVVGVTLALGGVKLLGVFGLL
ncbi:divalent metal cation transporter [Mangrovimicrobium sediminis]|uniref:Divalent metal cation transporter n=2 Tax=Mangrovimicrobium sediminis TaxID=2562682 RepID=A0A4Z0M302_9GAMM|nr:divalent metal cation transporter [Haliea sp. SAOS-164]